MNALFEDIAGQPDSLARVLDYLAGPGATNAARAAAEIRHAPKVVFSGMGSSLFAAISAASLMNAHGRAAIAIEASELLYFHRHLDRLTVAVLISRSGETIEVLKLLPVLRSRGIRIIGVTNVPESSLAAQADIALHLHSDADRMVAIRSYTGTLALLLSIAGYACSAESEQSARFPDMMRELIADEFEAESTLDEESRIYLLGRGPSLASVQEGVLLFHEAARTPAVGMSCAQFRHGPVEVVSPNVHFFVFASQPETRALDEQLAVDLKTLGAAARIVSPGLGGPWACLFEIIPIQIEAAKLAARRGIAAGVFQFAPLVTTTETGFGIA